MFAKLDEVMWQRMSRQYPLHFATVRRDLESYNLECKFTEDFVLRIIGVAPSLLKVCWTRDPSTKPGSEEWTLQLVPLLDGDLLQQELTPKSRRAAGRPSADAS